MIHTAGRILGIIALALASVAQAQNYPSKPIKLVVPYPAGGGTDFFARTVGAKMSENLGQQIVVDNRPGAATMIGAEAVARSPADGYTLLLGDSATYAVNPALYSKVPYDPQKDFAPVSLTGRFALLLVVNPAITPAKSVKELIEQAKKDPGKFNYASPGSGTPHHLAMELFKQQAGIDLVHVPYKGAAPAVQDLLGGQVPIMFLDLAAGGSHIRSGKLTALAVASPKRIAALPDVPTIAEAGVPGFEAWAWQGLAVPAKTPSDIIAKLNAEYAKAISDPALKQKIVDAGIEPLHSTPQQMTDYVKSEAVKWAQVVKSGNITVD